MDGPLKRYPGMLLDSGFALDLPSQGLALHPLESLTGGFLHL